MKDSIVYKGEKIPLIRINLWRSVMNDQEKDLKRVKEQIYNLIRSGMKTSEISAQFNYPLNIIKDVKSEYLEDEKKKDRQNKREDQLKHMENKRNLHHQRFLDRIGQSNEGVQEVLPVESVKDEVPVNNGQDATVQAPAIETAIEPT